MLSLHAKDFKIFVQFGNTEDEEEKNVKVEVPRKNLNSYKGLLTFTKEYFSQALLKAKKGTGSNA